MKFENCKVAYIGFYVCGPCGDVDCMELAVLIPGVGWVLEFEGRGMVIEEDSVLPKDIHYVPTSADYEARQRIAIEEHGKKLKKALEAIHGEHTTTLIKARRLFAKYDKPALPPSNKTEEIFHDCGTYLGDPAIARSEVDFFAGELLKSFAADLALNGVDATLKAYGVSE